MMSTFSFSSASSALFTSRLEEWAMVPKSVSSSSALMPMPLSLTVMVFAS